VAAAARLRETGFVRGDERIVVLNTGTGLKYPDLVPVDLPVLSPDERIPALPTSA
jgi:threonine synthase